VKYPIYEVEIKCFCGDLKVQVAFSDDEVKTDKQLHDAAINDILRFLLTSEFCSGKKIGYTYDSVPFLRD